MEAGRGSASSGTDRGYTGHEQLDDVGLIHMNGRMFDPRLGLFMQGDPFVQDPGNLQNFNRYGYCYNNPSHRCALAPFVALPLAMSLLLFNIIHASARPMWPGGAFCRYFTFLKQLFSAGLCLANLLEVRVHSFSWWVFRSIVTADSGLS